MTSNIASDLILAYRGRDYDRMKGMRWTCCAKASVRSFSTGSTRSWCSIRLTRDELRQIVSIQIGGLQQRLEERNRSNLPTRRPTISPSADTIRQYGARPLKRLVQHELETGLARKILAGEVRDGSRVVVDAGPRGLTFEVKEPAAKAAAA